jgi:hypothetical protein
LSNAKAVLDSGVSNGKIKVTFAIVNTVATVIFRMSTSNNYYYYYAFDSSIRRVVNGVETVLATLNPVPTKVNGDTIEITLNGNNILASYNNGLYTASIVDSFNATSTKHGFGSNNTTPRFDNFNIYS